ncbi:MAG: VTT domain-containing protein [Minisyncoccia bacterium]
MEHTRTSGTFTLQQYIGLAIWATVLASFVSFLFIKNIHLRDLLDFILEYTTRSWLGVMVFFLAYALRPILFVPAVFLSLLGGFLFGFWPGALYILVGETLSSNISYALGYFFGSDIISDKKSTMISKFKQHIEKASFVPILIMRLLYLPFEIVDYAAPMLGARWFPYFTATLLGSIPGAFTFASLGASVKNIDEMSMSVSIIDPRQALFSILCIVISFTIGYIAHTWYKRKYPHHH